MTASTERRSTGRPEKESRHRAREAAVQMLYQWEVGRGSMFEVGEVFWTHGPAASDSLSDELRIFATTLATGVAATVVDIDPMITEAAQNWRIERMNVLDRLILRLAIYEFLHEPETPAWPRTPSFRKSWRRSSRPKTRAGSSTACSMPFAAR